ncbi:hypothetical protein BO70DRAFT_427882 [Aspergillus heteromorphus CBS 117.55]|uniref:Uncharacterized protein n=1 Tax=Aspergillus heteromorphus CBS 117.55 TaxID=1448321 RepID=A0A317WP73_9EURO|nr:uncharacterized protein BO70DRAFT_427882 [Aspergillus heteromorphus CBS 117.55]PWY86887.1 hypothetical protein BO70DRAFT_427882 [Aspergillus heteromorphus CBS 117.55]
MNHSRTTTTALLNPMRPDHNLWGFTPQSQNNPSLSASKPDPVIYPSKDTHQPSVSRNQSPSMELVASTGRGKQLTVPEQVCLVNLCAASMDYYDAPTSPKSFWIKISAKLEIRTGRRYSWQSCRRRIQTYISKRTAYWNAYDDGRTLPTLDIVDEVMEGLDSWAHKCDGMCDEVQDPRLQATRETLAPEASVPLAAKIEPPKHVEPLRTLPEQGLVQHSTKLERVWAWLRSLPHPEEMDPMAVWAGELKAPPVLKVFPSVQTTPAVKHQVTFSSLIRDARHKKLGEQQPDLVASPELDTAPAPLPQSSLALPATSFGNKRPLEVDDAVPERPARRIRADPGSQPSGSSPAEDFVDGATLRMKLVETYFESTCGRLIDRLSTRLRGHDAKQPNAPGSCESILRDLFKDVGVAVAKAVIRMDENTTTTKEPLLN